MIFLIALGIGLTWLCWRIDPVNGLSGVALLTMILPVVASFGLVRFLTGYNPWFKPKRFDDRRVWLKGAGEEFLKSLADDRPTGVSTHCMLLLQFSLRPAWKVI